MSRSGYSDDCENPGLWQGAVANATRGPRGQAFLRELVDALDTMPVKMLAAEVFAEVEEDGERQVCAMGAVAVRRGLDTTGLSEAEPDEVGKVLGIPRALAAEIAYENDEGGGYRESDESRFHRMRDWASRRIRPPKPPTPTGTCSWCMRSFAVKSGVINAHQFNRGPCPGAGRSPRDNGSAQP